MALTEKQWIQLAYDRQKIALERLDTEQIKNTAVYSAQRKLVLESFEYISERLTEIEGEAKRNE